MRATQSLPVVRLPYLFNMSRFHKILFLITPLIVISLLWGKPLIALSLFILLNVITVIAVVSLKSGIFGPALTSNPRSDKLFLTFDDGPDPILTPKVLILLKKYNMKATFFLIAKKAKREPELTRQIISEGHAIGSHDLTHPWWANFRLYRQMKWEVTESVQIIESITNRKISLYRPPVGLTNPHTHRVCRELGLTIVGWNRSTGEAGNRFPKAIGEIAELKVQAGDIALLHDRSRDNERNELFLKSLEELQKEISNNKLITATIS